MQFSLVCKAYNKNIKENLKALKTTVDKEKNNFIEFLS